MSSLAFWPYGSSSCRQNQLVIILLAANPRLFQPFLDFGSLTEALVGNDRPKTMLLRCVAMKIAVFGIVMVKSLGACVLRDCLRSFADSVFRKFSREQESDRRLDFARRDRPPLVLVSKTRCFASDSFEDVVDERVHDAHRSAGNTNVGMNLFEHSVDEASIALLSRSLPLHDLGPSLATFAAFLGTFLGRTLLRALHR